MRNGTETVVACPNCGRRFNRSVNRGQCPSCGTDVTDTLSV